MIRPPPYTLDVLHVRSVEAHLSADDVAAYVDDTLPADERAVVEAHLAVCTECRDDVVATAALADSAASPTARRRWTPAWTVAAAAAVLFIAALPLLRARHGAPQREQRAITAPNAIQTVTPTAGALVSADSLRLTWRADSASTYRVIIMDSTGAEVYSNATADTSVALPSTVRLVPGANYFWLVDALSADGSSLSSHSQTFSVRR